MKKYALHLLLVLAIPAWLTCAAAAQEGDTGGTSADKPATEQRDGGKEGEKTVAPSEKQSTAPREDTEAAKKKAAKLAEKKKKAAKKAAPAEGEAAKEPAQEPAPDDGTGENLLLVDHERIKYDRIPGITVKADEGGQEGIVNVPDDKISGEKKKKEKEGEGIFGKNTRAIAGWGIVVLIFLLFVIYSKTRSRKSKRRVVRTVPKR